ncbi:cellulose binding domain-containing protein [Streptomyces olivaceus]|uniref:cellulose-binding domain-containing protein n=1 Tax=Streptomyces olivaceus TaxID=47716 RepID=UPI0004C9FDE6|nr:cellulose-binding domain-containing protein [Streptomyces olivaceus]MBZ6101110.1 cellulose-binding domain-containing protein [Streptomyces olivaceus]
MPDAPSPKDAAEAALLAESRDTVLSYADLCTAGSEAAARLAAEALDHGLREVRAAEATAAARGSARHPSRLPRVPLLLTAVRTTAAAWEEAGRGHELDGDLRRWLHSDRAARYAGPPPGRPLALRGLRDMQAADAELLWLADVEALPTAVVARRLGLDPATVSDELAQVREVFRDRCRRGHVDAPPSAGCRAYARLLDAVTRSPGADIPDDLSDHLTTCPDCAEAAACLRPHGTGLPAALASGVLGWGGHAYLERRRRAAEARLAAGRPGPADDGPADAAPDGTRRARLVRASLLATAVLVSLLALTVSLMPFGATAEDAAAPADTVDGRAATVPSPPSTPPPSPAGPETPPETLPAAPTSTGATPATSAASARSGASARSADPGPDPEPQGTATPTAPAGAPPAAAPVAGCTVRYDLAGQWPDGFQAAVSVTTADALDSWQVAWTFPDGQRVDRMWDASHTQDGSRVTATAADYNRSVPAGSTLTFGFLATWHDGNTPPHDFTLNGRDCG